MDMKVKDVAELLRIPEETVKQWLSEDKIPGYYLGEEVYFSRIEIENWLIHAGQGSLSKNEPESKAEYIGGMEQFCFYRALNSGDLYINFEGDKDKIFELVSQKVAPKLGLDAAVITDLLKDREKLLPTVLRKGIAVPHPQECLENLNSDYIFVVSLHDPIDYGSLDEEKVHTLFFLFSKSDRRHLQLLSKLADFVSISKNINFLQSQTLSKSTLLHYVREWEPSARKTHERERG